MKIFLKANSAKIQSLQRTTLRSFCPKVHRNVTPRNTQEYHNKKVYQSHEDDLAQNLRRPTSNIFSIMPLFPDPKKTIDMMDEGNVYAHQQLHDYDRFIRSREDDLKVVIKNNHKRKMREHIKSGFDDSDVIKQLATTSDKDMQKYISGERLEKEKSFITNEDEENLRKNFEELQHKIGILDLREFIALNKYLLDLEQHHEIINRIKAKFLSVALERMHESKAQAVKSMFKNIDKAMGVSGHLNELEKVDQLLKFDENAKELFYRFYYKIKEGYHNNEQEYMAAERKYEDMAIKLAEKQKFLKMERDEGVVEREDNYETNFNSYTDYVIAKYREQRTRKLRVTKDEIDEMIDKIANEEYPSYFSKWKFLKMVKYYTFFNKYKKLYVPTNLEIERLIYKYTKKKKIEEFTRMTAWEGHDDNFSEVSDDPDYFEMGHEFAISGPKTAKDELVFDEESKNKMLEYDSWKKQYYRAKYHAKREEYMKKLDDEISNELGVIFAANAFEMIKKPEGPIETNVTSFITSPDNDKRSEYRDYNRGGYFDFLDSLIENYHRESALEYMYQYNDYFSGKHKLRMKITQEYAKKVSLKEVNQLLNKMMMDLKKQYNDDLFRKPEYRYLNKDFTNYDFNLFNTIQEDYGLAEPDIYSSDQVASFNFPAVYQQIKDIKEKVENDEYYPPDLTENDLYEIEAYKAYKNDPVFKHYLYNHLSFFTEKLNDNFSTIPFAMKGIKPQDYIKYERIKINEMNRDKKEKIQNELAYREDQYLKNKKPFEESLEEKIDYQKVIPIAEQKKIKKVQPSFIGHGKRKRAFCLAQIILNGSGKITVNKKPFHFYFPNPGHRTKIMIPLVFADKLATVDVKIRVAGGGYNGQLDAIIPAIARAFVKYNPDLYTEFKKNLMLVHDPRNVERKHPGFIKARKAYVFNKR